MTTPPTEPLPPVPVEGKRRRWPVALLVAFVTGIVGAVAVAPIADWVMEMHHVSTMEGGRGCAVIIIWMPLAFIAGFVGGFALSLLVRRAGFVGYLLRQGVGFIWMASVIAVAAGVGYQSADHPPLIDGKNLALEMEVRVPTNGRSVEELKANDFSVALVVSDSDRSYSDLRWPEAQRTDEFITVPAWSTLNSRNAGREITVGVKDESRQEFNVLRSASPGKIDDTWSDWTPPRERFDHTKPLPNEQYFVRYRVRFAKEYSPTPTPTEASAAATLTPIEPDSPSPTPEP